jgi:hypothetical protein
MFLSFFKFSETFRSLSVAYVLELRFSIILVKFHNPGQIIE